VSQFSDSVQTKPRRRGLWHRLRRLIAYLNSLDPDEIRDLVAKFEANQRNIQASQRALTLQAHGGVPLISPLEFATGDRYQLESRCRALTNPAYIGNDTALCRVLGSYKMYLDTRDTGFGSHVLLDGYWEPWITVFVARQLRPGMVAIDVGANYGYYSLLFAALVGDTGHVFAIEPNPEIVLKLRRSLDLNGLLARTTLIEAAAGASDGGEVVLYVPHGEPKNGTVIASAEAVSPQQGALFKVPQVTIDQVADSAARIDFVKIDAEGAEESAISGMSRILARDKPCLLLEFNAHRYGDPRGFLDRLTAIYDRMRYIDFEANAVAVSIEDVLGRQSREDWMLYFDQPG
jgi:FkbM family methyltransferase